MLKFLDFFLALSLIFFYFLQVKIISYTLPSQNNWHVEPDCA